MYCVQEYDVDANGSPLSKQLHRYSRAEGAQSTGRRAPLELERDLRYAVCVRCVVMHDSSGSQDDAAVSGAINVLELR